MSYYKEKIHDAYAQTFAVNNICYRQTTPHFDLQIFHNEKFGRVMALDGVIQTTEGDEFIYHEMMTHVPIIAHGSARRVLIVGGGDGGMLREVLRHQQIEAVVQVEIDKSVIDVSRKYLPKHSAGAFDDPRLQLVIDDGCRFVARCEEKFDVIIVDSTDPMGPGEVLFSEGFYADCARLLTDKGVLVTQNGVAFFQIEEAISTAGHFSRLFKDHSFYSAAVPTYVGGIMLFGFACNDPTLRALDAEEIQKRITAAHLPTKYYNADIHVASFALPEYVKQAIEK